MRPRILLAAALALASCAEPAPPAPAAASAPPPVASAPPAAAPPTLRLPQVARPRRYDLDLTVVPSQETFSGTVGIDLEIAAPTQILWLNATGLTLGEARLTSGGTSVAARVVPGGDDFVGFAFDAPVGPGPARLTVAYRGPIDKERSRGLYRQAEGGGDVYAYTFFEPLDARRAFPCFDEPGYKVPWKLTLHVQKGHVALANTAVVAETDEPGGMKAVAFAESKPLPSYLVAFVVGPFDVVPAGTAGHHGTPLRFIVPRGRGAETRYAAEVTPRIIGLLEDYFGMPYPYGKLDVAVVPRYWGTMEHPGLVALGQPLTLIKPDEESIERKQHYANIATHELCHYWFGDYVTMAWWDDTWLNEALATWLDTKLTDRLDPSWRFAEIHRAATWAMPADSLESAKKVRQPIVKRTDIEDSFDGELTYAKGAAVLGMFERFLGPEVFQRGIRRFMKDHAWGNAATEDLLAALSAEAGRDVGPAFKTFLEQPGVPLVSVDLRCGGGGAPRLDLTQERFIPRGSGAAAGATWQIPVCVKLGAGKTTEHACTLLTERTGSLPLPGGACPDWVLPNEDAAGYYRASASIDVLRRLLGPARDKLTAVERAALLEDAAARTGAGTLSLGDALSLVPPIVKSGGRVELTQAYSLLGAVRPDALPADLRKRYAHFLASTYGQRARALGWKPRPSDTPDDLVLRPQMLGLLGGPGEDAAVRREAHALALGWLDDRAALRPELTRVALGLAGRSNDRALFEHLRAAARAAQDHRERGELLGALGGFTDPALEREALSLLMSPDVDLRESDGILWHALSTPETREVAYRFLESNFDALVARMRSDEASQLFRVPSFFCDEEHRAAAAAFFGPRAEKIDGASRTLSAALEEVRVCVEATKLNRASVEAFLARY